MNYNKIEDHEKSFESTLIDSSGNKYTCREVVDLGNGAILKKMKPATSGFFYVEETRKNMIVVHATIGVLKGDLATLTKQDSHMGVSYLIGRNGIAYELYNPKYWSYHLGMGSVGGNKSNSSRSIGIELSNMGPLKNVNGNLETVYSRQSYIDANKLTKIAPSDVYCTIDDHSAYTHVADAFRGYNYFSSYTSTQYVTLNKLVRYLSNAYSIPLNYLPDDNRNHVFPSDISAIQFNGICSHINYRPSGKWDVGTDFNWDAIINDIKAPESKPIDVIPLDVIKAIDVPLSPNTGLPPFLVPNNVAPVEPPSIIGGFLKSLFSK